jgi:hypothetical protein
VNGDKEQKFYTFLKVSEQPGWEPLSPLALAPAHTAQATLLLLRSGTSWYWPLIPTRGLCRS